MELTEGPTALRPMAAAAVDTLAAVRIAHRVLAGVPLEEGAIPKVHFLEAATLVAGDILAAVGTEAAVILEAGVIGASFKAALAS